MPDDSRKNSRAGSNNAWVWDGPVIRTEVIKSHPELRQVLDQLAGILDDTTMQRLN